MFFHGFLPWNFGPTFEVLWCETQLHFSWVGQWKVRDLWSWFGVSSKIPTTIMGRDQGARIEPFYDNKDSHADGDGGCSVRRCLWERQVCHRRNDWCRLGGNWPISYRETHCQPVSFGVGKMMLAFFLHIVGCPILRHAVPTWRACESATAARMLDGSGNKSWSPSKTNHSKRKMI